MTSPHISDQLRHLLLDMISTVRPVGAEQTASLNIAVWDVVCNMAGQYRLGPILHQHCKTRGEGWIIPNAVRTRWASAYRQSALRALRVQQMLLKLDKIFYQSSIPYAALKGAWLIQKAYPHPALRPMRDIAQRGRKRCPLIGGPAIAQVRKNPTRLRNRVLVAQKWICSFLALGQSASLAVPK